LTCGKSKRLAEELLAAGFTRVQRYQAGIPVWRAAGHVTEMEASAAKRVRDLDQTAVFIDVLDAHAKQGLACGQNRAGGRT
jgi:hypothetical protein